MVSRLSKTLNEDEKRRLAEIDARRSRLWETRRWLDGELTKAQDILRAVESSHRSLNEEMDRLTREADNLNGYNDPWPERDEMLARVKERDDANRTRN